VRVKRFLVDCVNQIGRNARTPSLPQHLRDLDGFWRVDEDQLKPRRVPFVEVVILGQGEARELEDVFGASVGLVHMNAKTNSRTIQAVRSSLPRFADQAAEIVLLGADRVSEPARDHGIPEYSLELLQRRAKGLEKAFDIRAPLEAVGETLQGLGLVLGLFGRKHQATVIRAVSKRAI
jgi:hypothetical protein